MTSSMLQGPLGHQVRDRNSPAGRVLPLQHSCTRFSRIVSIRSFKDRFGQQLFAADANGDGALTRAPPGLLWVMSAIPIVVFISPARPRIPGGFDQRAALKVRPCRSKAMLALLVTKVAASFSSSGPSLDILQIDSLSPLLLAEVTLPNSIRK